MMSVSKVQVSLYTVAAVALGFGANAWAVPVLQVTEIYEGVDGPDGTVDWAEITNFGDMTFTFGVDGELYYDDDSQDPTVDERVFGITDIAPGESVIVALSNTATDAIGFFNFWGAGNLTGVEIGYIAGDNAPGLGQGGDQVNFFDGNTAGANLIDSASFAGSDNGVQGRTWVYNVGTNSWDGATQAVDGTWGAFTAPNFAGSNGDLPIIGSPGLVPEPATIGLLAMGGLLAARRRR
jgi:hypothetical protein